jgi:hypothetical protein
MIMDNHANYKRLPDETPKAYTAFTYYRSLQLDGEGDKRRTLTNVTKHLGHASPSVVEKWSSKYEWVERAAAWDEKRRDDIMRVQDVGLEEAQQAVTSNLMLKIAALNKVVNNEINNLLELQAIGESIAAVELKRITDVVATLDTLARRATNMPTTFRSTEVEHHEETQVFMMGMEDEE